MRFWGAYGWIEYSIFFGMAVITSATVLVIIFARLSPWALVIPIVVVALGSVTLGIVQRNAPAEPHEPEPEPGDLFAIRMPGADPAAIVRVSGLLTSRILNRYPGARLVDQDPRAGAVMVSVPDVPRRDVRAELARSLTPHSPGGSTITDASGGVTEFGGQ